MEYGEKISTLRKMNGMTQAELGAALNVTFQAVSKWERGESYPDFETLSKIAKLFGVSISYFEDGDYVWESASTYAPALIGVCTVCGKSIYDSNEVAPFSSTLVCKDCYARKRSAKEAERKRAYENRQAKARRQVFAAKHMRNKGLITAGVVCGVFLVLLIVGLILEPTGIGEAIGSYAIITLFLFPFIAQLFWKGFIVDVVCAGFKIIGTPGIIFTFDLDGFIFLIVMKILFAVIKLAVLLLCMAVCIIAAFFMSPFSFIPACVKLSRGILPED